MAAGQGFKNFSTGDVLTASDVNGYLMQGVWVFANAAARDAAVTSPQEGNTCYLKDTDAIMVYSGSAWVTKSGSSPLTTKGDLYTYSTTDTRLAVGTTNGHVLQVDSTAATGMKWDAVPAASYTYTNFTPTVTQSGSVAVTTVNAAYATIGDFVHVYMTLVCTGTGTGANAVIVTLPAGVPAINTHLNNYESPIGVGQLYDTSATLMYRCLPVATSGTTIRLAPTNDTSASRLGQVQFTAALTTDDRILLNLYYRKA